MEIWIPSEHSCCVNPQKVAALESQGIQMAALPKDGIPAVTFKDRGDGSYELGAQDHIEKTSVFKSLIKKFVINPAQQLRKQKELGQAPEITQMVR